MTHLAIFLPGRGYTNEHPLLYYARTALAQLGATEVLITYDDPGDDDRFYAGVQRDIVAAVDAHRPERLTLVGKSLGTQAIAHLVQNVALPVETRIVWMTPVWKWDAIWEGAMACTWPSLYVVGLADLMSHDPERHAQLPGSTIAIDGANHSLEIEGDVVASLDTLRRVTAAVIDFACATHGEEGVR